MNQLHVMIELVMRYATVLFFVFLLNTAACCGVSGTQKHDAPAFQAYLFTGYSIEVIRPGEKLDLQKFVTSGNWAVVFFAADGHHPSAEVLRSPGAEIELKTPDLAELREKGKGAVIGVVYRPVMGGKLRPRRGIGNVFRNEKILFTGEKGAFETSTDDLGVYSIILPEGEYSITIEGAESGGASVAAGGTVIKNIQKGMVLID